MPKPTIELVKQTDGGWEIKLTSPKGFDELLGRDVLNAFCRCFVHANRLISTISCMHTSKQFHGQGSVAFRRDQDTLLWFMIGTLRELARAIQGLRVALAKRQLLDPKSEQWVALRELEMRWEKDAFFRGMRNSAAFHVDKEAINNGLDELLLEPHVTLAKGKGRKEVDSWLTLGFQALHNGLSLDLDRYGKFLDVVMADLKVAVPAIQGSFILAAEAAGVPFGDG